MHRRRVINLQGLVAKLMPPPIQTLGRQTMGARECRDGLLALVQCIKHRLCFILRPSFSAHPRHHPPERPRRPSLSRRPTGRSRVAAGRVNEEVCSGLKPVVESAQESVLHGPDKIEVGRGSPHHELTIFCTCHRCPLRSVLRAADKSRRVRPRKESAREMLSGSRRIC